jgi:hypothetical protein
MHCKAKLLRSRGQRRPDHEIASDAGHDGELTLALCGGAYELKLAARDDSQQKPIIPILYDARLVTMHGNKMLFRGIERTESGAGYEQELSAMVIGI